ncbi:hypothetical protein J6N69_00470 [bacterium]|nr:hypothetical protein [bacterium]
MEILPVSKLKVNNRNNIVFGSRINFVDSKTFDDFRRGAYVDFRKEGGFSAKSLSRAQKYKNKFEQMINPPKMNMSRTDVILSDEFYTEGVRTCTAGGVIDLKSGKCLGFHFYDSLDNMKKVDEMIANIFDKIPNPDGALILGGKNLKCSNYSLPIFEKITEAILSKIKRVTVLREHLYPFSETDMHYSLKNDTWTIYSMFRPVTEIKERYISSKSDLQNCFREVKIAASDSVNFIKP